MCYSTQVRVNSYCCAVRVLLVGLLACASTNVAAGTLPSDVAVGLTAEPDSNLRPGDEITFAVSATNIGPEPIQYFMLASSLVHDEMLPYTSSPDCDGDSYAVGTDEEGHPITEYRWTPAVDVPMAIGETRYCRFQLVLSDTAPASFAFSFGMASTYPDQNPNNDTATVRLTRAAYASVPVPTMSRPLLVFLCAMLTCIGITNVRAGSRRSS